MHLADVILNERFQMHKLKYCITSLIWIILSTNEVKVKIKDCEKEIGRYILCRWEGCKETEVVGGGKEKQNLKFKMCHVHIPTTHMNVIFLKN